MATSRQPMSNARPCAPERLHAAIPQPDVISRMRVGLGTFIAIEAEAPRQRAAEDAVAAAFGAVDRVERLMHPNRSGSDLSLLHEAPIGVPVKLHAWTWATLDLCRRLNHRSLGVFDPCTRESPGRLVDLELRHPSIAIAHAALRLDLGGIAKGFAVDRALDQLRLFGCTAGLVNAGGDVAVFGALGRELWYRRQDGRSAVVALRNAALAASDADDARRPAEHRGYYHGADPATRAVTGCAVVTAPSAAVADGLTKCVLLGDRVSMRPTLESFGARQILFEEST